MLCIMKALKMKIVNVETNFILIFSKVSYNMSLKGLPEIPSEARDGVASRVTLKRLPEISEEAVRERDDLWRGRAKRINAAERAVERERVARERERARQEHIADERARGVAEEKRERERDAVQGEKKKALSGLDAAHSSGIRDELQYKTAVQEVNKIAKRHNETEHKVEKKYGNRTEPTTVYLNTIDNPNYIRFINDEREITLDKLSTSAKHADEYIFRVGTDEFIYNKDLNLAFYDTVKGAYGGDLSWGGGKKKRRKYSKKSTKRRKSNKIKHTKRRKSKKKTKRRR